MGEMSHLGLADTWPLAPHTIKYAPERGNHILIELFHKSPGSPASEHHDSVKKFYFSLWLFNIITAVITIETCW